MSKWKTTIRGTKTSRKRLNVWWMDETEGQAESHSNRSSYNLPWQPHTHTHTHARIHTRTHPYCLLPCSRTLPGFPVLFLWSLTVWWCSDLMYKDFSLLSEWKKIKIQWNTRSKDRQNPSEIYKLLTCGQRGFLSPCEKITEKGRAEEEGEEGRFQKGKKKGKGKLRRKGKEI